MTTTTLTLTDFILARIAELEAAARAATPAPWRAFSMDGEEWTVLAAKAHVARGLDEQTARLIALDDPARVLARCAAERRIVELHLGSIEMYRNHLSTYGDDAGYSCFVCEDGPGRHEGDIEHQRMPCPTLRLLALPDADHPDYREEWTP